MEDENPVGMGGVSETITRSNQSPSHVKNFCRSHGLTHEIALDFSPARRQNVLMSKTIHLPMPATGEVGQLRLPGGVQRRLDELLDRQDKGIKLSVSERREAEGLVEMAEWLSLLKLRAQRLQRVAA